MMDYTNFVVDRAQHMRPLEYDLSDNFNELVRYLHDVGALNNLPVGTIGPSEILSASDALSAPLRSLVVDGKSTQDGTPTPDAPVPIASVTGDSDGNIILRARGFNQCSIVRNDIFVNGATSKIGSITNGATAVLEVIPNTDYCLTYTGGNRCIIAGVDSMTPAVGDDARIIFNVSVRTSPKVFNTGDNRYVACFIATSVAPASDICINLSDPARNGTYAPYTESVAPVPLDGHELRSLPDGTRDTLALTYLRPSTREGWAWYTRSVERAVGHIADMGELAWNTFAYSGALLMYANIPDMIEAQGGITTLLCSGYVAQASKNISELVAMPDLTCAPRDTYKNVYVKNSNYTDAAAFKAAVAGMTLDYQLATPITETLDPIELPSLPAPSVTIWATADATPTLTAEYVRDLSAAINDMQEAIADI